MTVLATDMKDLVFSSGSLEAYLASIKNIPVLSAEEEKGLFESFQKHDDLEAARKLVMSHLRFVAYIARSYQGYGLPDQDLIQEGNVGLMKAVKKYDLEKGVRLISFAVHWIKAEIHEYILKNWKIVKIATTKAQRKLFFNLRKQKKMLGWFSKQEVECVAKDLGVKQTEVLEMESRLAGQDENFDSFDDQNEAAPVGPSEKLSLGDKENPAVIVGHGAHGPHGSARRR